MEDLNFYSGSQTYTEIVPVKRMLKKFIRFLITTVILLPLVLTSYVNISDCVNASPSGSESIDGIALRIVRTCFEDTNRLITLSGDVSQNLVAKIHKSEFTALTIMSTDVPSIDKDYTIAKQSLAIYNHRFYFRFEHKAQGFILAAASQPVLRRQIKVLKNSRWWKAAGLLIIIDDGTTMNNSCKNAQTFMWLAWRSNILSSVFLCQDTDERLMLYSYNPYNSMGAKNWQKVSEHRGRSGHPWILFRRNATFTPNDCSEIFFDKTKTLDDYKIRSNSISMRPRLSIDYNKTGIERYGGLEGKIIQSIFRFLNASVEDIPYTGIDPIGYADENGTYYGMLSDVFSGRVDIGMNGRYMVDMWKLRMSYPHSSTDICFLVKSRGNVPQWMNLTFVFDVWITSGLITVTILTTLVLSYYSKFSAGCMNSLRLVISTSLLRLPLKFPLRLFLINAFFLFLIANSIFQGRWTSLLTKPRAYSNPETQADLGIAGYKVAGYPPYAKFIDDPVLHSHFAISYSLKCDQEIKSDEALACIMDCDGIYIYVKNLSEFHIVSQRLQKFYMIFVTSQDWPLFDRFNQLVRRLSESGLPRYWKSQDIQIATASHHGGEFREGNRSPFLSLADLAFIFYWLLFSLLLSTLVFFCEILSTRCGFRFGKI